MSDTKFRPVQGADEKIKQSPYTEGYVYFATDTGRIYLDTEGERVPLGGGGVSILYSQAAEVKENVDGTYTIQLEDLDDSDAKPSMDDLIINSDGRFFKVIDSDDVEMICSLIAVSGTGGGGGSSGGDSGGTTATIKLEQITGVRGPYIFGQPAYAVFKATATEDYDVTYTITVQSSDGAKKSIQRSAESGAEFSFDIGSELYVGLNLVTVTASGANSGSTSPRRYTNVNCIEMLLKESPDFNPLLTVSGALEFKCMPVGEISKTLKIYIDGEIQPDLTLENFTTSDEERSITIPPQEHGVHTIKAVLSTGSGTAEAVADPLEYEIAWIENGNLTPIIWFKEIPEQIVNHENFVLNYKILNPANREKAEASLYINQMEIATSPVTVSYDTANLQWEKWAVTGYRVGENTLTIACGTTSRSITLLVVKDDRNMEIATSGLFLNLTADGRSNSENKTSRSQWSYTNASNETTSVTFNNFNWYNNGWILDSEDKSCLRISNGASISVPLKVLQNETLSNSLTFEFQFKLHNVQNYSTLITTTSYEDETTGKVVINKSISVDEGVFANYFNNDIGFCLGTQEAFFKSSGNAIVDARYKEDELINLTFVIESTNVSSVTPLMYIYLNGVLSGISTYSSSDKFGAEVEQLVFNSNYCDIDLYKLRVYKTNLPSHTVVNNYIADLNDAELYDMNQIVKFSNGVPKVDYGLMVQYNSANPDNPTMPYAVVEVFGDTDDERLPYKKGNKRNLNVTFVNPSLDRAYENGEITGEQYITGCPSFKATCASFDVQGTSSQGYPRRNFKGKFKNNKDYPNDCTWVYTNGPLKDLSLLDKNEYNGTNYKGFYMDNKDSSETTFTWKADYMESSMCHNTGFASFVKTLYTKHPLVDYLGDDYTTGDHRTTIYGFPMMVFQKYKDGTYEFVGRYNFNLDKGCNNVIDFENETEHPFVTNEDGTKPTFAEIAECWELKNNQGGRCSFNLVNFDEVDENGNLALHSDFEYRYSYYEDDIDDAIDRKDPYQDPSYANEYLLERFNNLKKLCDWLYSVNTTKVDKDNPVELPEAVTYGTGAGQKTFTHDTVDYRLAKFQYEFKEHFNLEYCLVYFIMTELLIQYDSRGKNMMLGSWGPQKEGGEYIWYPLYYDIDTQLGVNNSGVPSWEYFTEATETQQFSTSDSVLWNNFFSCFKTDIESKYKELRNGNLNIANLDGYYNFTPEVSKSYAMKGCRPINVINVDEYYKYIAPAFSGYLDTDGKTQTTTLYFYCLQGTREMHRSLFLKNRFNFMDSKWLAGVYDTTGKQQEFKIRFNANFWDSQDSQGKYTSDRYIETAPSTDDEYIQTAIKEGRLIIQPYGNSPYDTKLDFEITPYLNQYVSVWYDDALAQNPVRFDGEEAVVIPPLASVLDSVKNTLNFSQQLLYISGSEYLSSLGDLSLKYPDEFQITKAKRLKDLYIGNDDSGYINNVMKDDAFYLNAGAYVAGEGNVKVANENAKTLLETVVLSNISSLSSPQDLSGSTKLKQLRALGTQLGGVELAEGVPIEQLYLPQTITYFNLTEPTNLHGLIETTPEKDSDGNFPNGLYIEGITDKTSYTAEDKIKLYRIDIRGGSLGYDSYKLLDKVVNVKDRMQANANLDSSYNKRLYLFLEDVNWTPYRQVEKGELSDSTLKYVKKTEHYTFDHTYEPDDNWDSDVLNGRIYEYDEENFLANANVLTSLDMIDKFINSYNSSENYYRSTVEADGAATLPYLTGNIYINNSEDDLISEADLKNVYKDLYYPDLNIFVAHAAESYVAKFVEVLDSGIEKEWETLKYDPSGDISYPDPSQIAEITPTKLHYDFVGWATSPTATEVITDFSQYKFSESNKVYIFYAIYKKHEYTISFYNYDGTTLLSSTKVPYNEPLSEPNLMPYRDDSALALEKRYGFKGYTIDKLQTEITNENDIKDIVKDVSSMIADRNWDLYACFMEESVYNSVLDSSYYQFDNTVYVDNFDSQYSVATEGTGVRLRLIKEVSGKITLPTVDDTGRPVISVTGRKNSSSSMTKELTHLFWDKKNSNEVRRIDDQAFADSTKLKYIEYGDKLREIGNNSFGRCFQLEVFEWAKNIVVLRPQSFNQAYQKISASAINQLTIGGKVQRIEGDAKDATTGAFSYNDKDFTVVQFGTETQPSEMVYLGDKAFTFNPKSDGGVYTIKKLIVYYSDDTIKQNFESWVADGRLPCDEKEFILA